VRAYLPIKCLRIYITQGWWVAVALASGYMANSTLQYSSFLISQCPLEIKQKGEITPPNVFQPLTKMTTYIKIKAHSTTNFSREPSYKVVPEAQSGKNCR